METNEKVKSNDDPKAVNKNIEQIQLQEGVNPV